MKIIYLCFIWVCCICLHLNAQDPGKDSIRKVEELEEVVIALNKWEQKPSEVPNKIVKVSLRDARLQNPQTSADLLGMTGAVYIQKSQLGGGSPMIRGFSTNRVMIVIDGVRMNNAIYRSGNLQNVISIDALSTESAEVIFGPGSIVYGSDAIGGVMDFHSLQPRYSAEKKWKNKVNAVARYSTASDERTGHIDFATGNNRLAYLGSLTYTAFDDLKMGKNGGHDSYLRPTYVSRVGNKDSVFINQDPRLQRFTGYSQLNVLQKLRFKATDHLDLQYTFHYSGTSDIPRYDRLIETAGSSPSFGDWYYGPQLWRMHALQAALNKPTSLYESARVVAAYQNYQESRNDRRFNNARLRNQTEKVKIFSTNIDFNKVLNDANQLFYGVEYITNRVGSFATRKNINTGVAEPIVTRYPNNSDWKSYGLYSSFRSTVNKFTFNAGARYNHVTVYAPFDTSLFRLPFNNAEVNKGALTGNLGLVFRPTPRSQLNFNLATGFRVPNVDDLGKVFESAPGQLVVPNSNLRAEYAYNVDLGYAINVDDKFKFDITAFYTILDNAIVKRPSKYLGQDSVMYEGVRSRVFDLQNAAKANAYGVQTSLEIYFFKNLSWLIQGNWIEGEETDDNNDVDVPLRHAPPFYGNTHLKLNGTKFRADVYLLWNGEIASDEMAPSEQAKTFIYAVDPNGRPYSPSWYTVNIKTSYKLSKFLTVTGGWENITNQRYRSYSSGIVSAGSNVVFSVRACL